MVVRRQTCMYCNCTCILSTFRIRIYDNCFDLTTTFHRGSHSRVTSIVAFATSRFAVAIRFRASELDEFVELCFVCALRQLGHP